MGGEVEESVFFDYGERILRLALLAQDDMINNNSPYETLMLLRIAEMAPFSSRDTWA